MSTYVAFLRAINVAGHAVVRMTELQRVFSSAGCKHVSTCIQSGNVIFEAPDERAPALFDRIRVKLGGLVGGEPGVFFRTGRALDRMVKAAPFKGFEAERDVKLYVAFLSQEPRSKPSLPLSSSKEAVELIAMKPLEAFIVSRRKKNRFYGFPNNFIEKELGVSATSRNWSTVTKIVDLVREQPVGG